MCRRGRSLHRLLLLYGRFTSIKERALCSFSWRSFNQKANPFMGQVFMYVNTGSSCDSEADDPTDAEEFGTFQPAEEGRLVPLVSTIWRRIWTYLSSLPNCWVHAFMKNVCGTTDNTVLISKLWEIVTKILLFRWNIFVGLLITSLTSPNRWVWNMTLQSGYSSLTRPIEISSWFFWTMATGYFDLGRTFSWYEGKLTTSWNVCCLLPTRSWCSYRTSRWVHEVSMLHQLVGQHGSRPALSCPTKMAV